VPEAERQPRRQLVAEGLRQRQVERVGRRPVVRRVVAGAVVEVVGDRDRLQPEQVVDRRCSRRPERLGEQLAEHLHLRARQRVQDRPDLLRREALSGEIGLEARVRRPQGAEPRLVAVLVLEIALAARLARAPAAALVVLVGEAQREVRADR
jgi:hypothetical protein